MSRGAALLLCGASALMLGCAGDPTGPSTPATPSALAIQELTTGELVISWTDNSDNESGFQLDRSKGAAGTFSEIASVGADVSTYQDSAVDGASEYCYRVRALGAAGSSPSAFSAPACHQFAAPAAPSDLGAIASLEQVDLSWTDNSDNETGFEVWRSTTGASGTFALEATVGAEVKSFGNTGLQDNAEYCYRVRATGSGGLDSPFTATACATTPTPQAPPPAAPSDLAAVPTSPLLSRSPGWTMHRTRRGSRSGARPRVPPAPTRCFQRRRKRNQRKRQRARSRRPVLLQGSGRRHGDRAALRLHHRLMRHYSGPSGPEHA